MKKHELSPKFDFGA